MDKEKVYASDTDESDEDFQPDHLAGESPASEDDETEDSEVNEELGKDTKKTKGKSTKRKTVAKKINKKKKSKPRGDEESDDEENTCSSRRATRQIGNSITNGKGKTLEKYELESDEEDKSRTNELWADFLKDVNSTSTTSEVKTAKSEGKTSFSCSNDKKADENIKKSHTLNGLTAKEDNEKTVITEIVDFAGEEVHIQREIDTSSIKENKAVVTQPAKKQPFSRLMPGAGVKRTLPMAATGSSTGLGSILNQLGKKKKLSVLEKSKMDWTSFKQDEGIDEQLQTFNKGKDGYLERQDFLQRTDLRQFEIEKNLRQTTRRPY